MGIYSLDTRHLFFSLPLPLQIMLQDFTGYVFLAVFANRLCYFACPNFACKEFHAKIFKESAKYAEGGMEEWIDSRLPFIPYSVLRFSGILTHHPFPATKPARLPVFFLL